MSWTGDLTMPRDHLPRKFQGDLDRFFRRVIYPALSEFSPHENVKLGECSSMDEFLDNAEKHTSNFVSYEARRSFALTLAASFERQLRIWARVHFPEAEMARVGNLDFESLLSK